MPGISCAAVMPRSRTNLHTSLSARLFHHKKFFCRRKITGNRHCLPKPDRRILPQHSVNSMFGSYARSAMP